MEIHHSNGSSPLVLAPLWLGQKHDMYWSSDPNFLPCGGTPHIQPKLIDVIMAGKGRYLVVVYPILTTDQNPVPAQQSSAKPCGAQLPKWGTLVLLPIVPKRKQETKERQGKNQPALRQG